MEISDVKYSQYLQILREELLPAMGCTEPIAMAYAAAKARQTLGAMPNKIDIVISGNIIKNVKSVVVPNTGGLKGIAAAVAAGRPGCAAPAAGSPAAPSGLRHPASRAGRPSYNLSVCFADSSPSRGASGEETKLYGMPKPPLDRGGGIAKQ